MGSTKSIVFAGLFIVVLITSKVLTNDVQSLNVTTSSIAMKTHCSDIDLQEDQCGFVKRHCHGFSAMYLTFYYCSSLWKPAAMGILLSGLLLLFGAISVVASDFFCPNLQTIASKLDLSESLAGVTILAFGNGSPDLFGTFSAMDTGSGSMAIGEIIGAAFFIVSVITGCMGIIRPFQSKRITFMRDASFLTGAVALLTWIVYHGKIYWYHGLALIGYYITYVVTVLLSSYQWGGKRTQHEKDQGGNIVVTQHLLDETSRLLGTQGKPPRLEIPDNGFSQPHLGHILRPTSPLSSNPSLRIDTSQLRHNQSMPRTTSTNGSISTLRPYRRAMTPRVGIRTSVFSAIEFTSQVSAIRRASSTQQMIAAQSSSLMVPDQRRQRQVSVPQGFWQRTSNLSINSMQYRRPRASTTTTSSAMDPVPAPPTILPTSGRPTTPDSTNSSMGMAEDYFAYLSTHQPQPPPPPQIVIPAPELTIPEIRLAPPMIEQYHTPIAGSSNNSRLPSPQPAASSLHVITPSPSMTSTCTDDDCFVSARQSPELTPVVGSFFDHPSTTPATAVHDEDDALEQKHVDTVISWYDTLLHITQVLFPTLQEWSNKSWLSCFSSLVAMPLVLIFTLTLPVAESENVKIDQVEVIRDDDDDYVYHTSAGAHTPSPTYYYNQSSNTSPTTQPPPFLPQSSSSSGHYGGCVLVQPPTVTDHLYVPSATSYLAVPSAALETNNEIKPSPSMLTELDAEFHQGWCRWLVAVQAIFSITFLFCILAMNSFIAPEHIWIGVAIGCVLSTVVLATTQTEDPPSWFWMLSFAGFVISLNWIFFLANSMVGLLQALGKIFDISEAIMGLTVFAFGNSVGDLVSNTAIAKMGLPVMALSACYAGPLLNMVLSVGVSSTYQIWKAHGHPYPIVIPPTILISAGGLLTVLLSTLFVVNMNDFHVTKQLGYWTISVYVFCCITNILLEFKAFHP